MRIKNNTQRISLRRNMRRERKTERETGAGSRREAAVKPARAGRTGVDAGARGWVRRSLRGAAAGALVVADGVHAARDGARAGRAAHAAAAIRVGGAVGVVEGTTCPARLIRPTARDGAAQRGRVAVGVRAG